ncbi:MAG: hypothetical protein H8E72_08900 [Candidatus Marinimicrobia bacterium]|nr:hypothetical protein [Candidatus Neomarinimicrobiota bacterium]
MKNTISNVPGDINEIYEFNLAFAEDTDNSDTITLTWTKNADITAFNMEIDGQINTASEENKYIFSLLPGLFKDVIVTADDVLSETIKVFSSPMAPSTWSPDFVGDIKVTESFTDNGTPYNEFGWIESTETDIANVQLQKCGYVNTPNECLELSDFLVVESFDSQNSTYSETKNFGEKACYIINSTDQSGNSRYSQIICNDLTANAMLDITITSISINLDNKISLEWTEYSESDFYQYTLYRSENEGVDSESRIVLAEIIDASQTVFEDRNNIGVGKTWYYQIEVHNQYGRISESNIKSGKSKP